MKDQLIHYVDLLFAGAPDASDIKQEILQNTLDRYDDLITHGKSPQAAYSLAIAGIGDVSELLQYPEPAAQHQNSSSAPAEKPAAPIWKKTLRAVAVCLYILCPVPLFVLGELNMDTLGLCGLLALVAVATALMVIAGGNKSSGSPGEEKQPPTPQQELRNATKTIIFTVGLCIYLALSFATGAWWITWLVFPIIAAVQGLVRACIDLKEAEEHEA